MTRKKKPALEPLEERIGHRFENRALLEQALTHMSMVRSGGRKASYQRLEFLGDRVLGLAVAEMLMRAFPKATEGELSQRLSQLVRKATCGEVAETLDLAPYVRLDRGGKPTPTIIADACEALIGAVFLDAGYGKALEVVERHWGERLTRKARPERDAKTLLQEWALARGLPPPHYREVERRGPDHKPEFKVAVELPGLDACTGVARTKRDAEQAAAGMMLAQAALAGSHV